MPGVNYRINLFYKVKIDRFFNKPFKQLKKYEHNLNLNIVDISRINRTNTSIVFNILIKAQSQTIIILYSVYSAVNKLYIMGKLAYFCKRDIKKIITGKIFFSGYGFLIFLTYFVEKFQPL